MRALPWPQDRLSRQIGWPIFARLADATSESEWVATDCFAALRS